VRKVSRYDARLQEFQGDWTSEPEAARLATERDVKTMVKLATGIMERHVGAPLLQRF
jgi:hypothetical protein